MIALAFRVAQSWASYEGSDPILPNEKCPGFGNGWYCSVYYVTVLYMYCTVQAWVPCQDRDPPPPGARDCTFDLA